MPTHQTGTITFSSPTQEAQWWVNVFSNPPPWVAMPAFSSGGHQPIATPTPQSEPLQAPTPMPYFDEDIPEPKVDIKVGDVWKHHQGVYLAKILEDCGENWGEEFVRVDIYRAGDHTDFIEMGVKRKKRVFGNFWTLLSRAPKKHLRHYFEGVEDVGK